MSDSAETPTPQEAAGNELLETVLSTLDVATGEWDRDVLLRGMSLVLVLLEMWRTDSTNLAQAIQTHMVACTSSNCVCNMPVALRVHRDITTRSAELDAALNGLSDTPAPSDPGPTGNVGLLDAMLQDSIDAEPGELTEDMVDATRTDPSEPQE